LRCCQWGVQTGQIVLILFSDSSRPPRFGGVVIGSVIPGASQKDGQQDKDACSPPLPYFSLLDAAISAYTRPACPTRTKSFPTSLTVAQGLYLPLELLDPEAKHLARGLGESQNAWQDVSVTIKAARHGRHEAHDVGLAGEVEIGAGCGVALVAHHVQFTRKDTSGHPAVCSVLASHAAIAQDPLHNPCILPGGGLQVELVEDNISEFYVVFSGPKDSEWGGGACKLSAMFRPHPAALC
jgi:hypothetical protein